MRDNTVAIPSIFYRHDSTITAVDRFVCQNDLAQMRLNHNILKARRVRKVLATMSCASGGTGASATRSTFASRGRADNGRVGNLLAVIPIRVTPGIKQVGVSVYGGTMDATDSILYPVVHSISETPVINTGVSITVTAGGVISPEYCYVPLSRLARNRPEQLVSIFMQSEVLAVTAAAALVTAVDAQWYAGGPAAVPGDVIVSPTNAAMTPRMVRARRNGGYVVDEPFDTILAVGLDTVEIRATKTVTLQSISVWEDRITSIAAQDDVEGEEL